MTKEIWSSIATRPISENTYLVIRLNRRVPNGTHGGVRVGGKSINDFPPTRLLILFTLGLH